MDDALVLAVRHLKVGQAVGDSAQVVVQQFRPRLLSYFRHHNFSDADAEDLVQETFRRVLAGIHGLNDESKFLPWLFQIARNVQLSARAVIFQRKEEALDSVETARMTDSSEDAVSRSMNRERVERVWKALDQLPPRQKQCLVMRTTQEMSYEEIATVMRLSVNTVRNHLREARLHLKRLLDGDA